MRVAVGFALCASLVACKKKDEGGAAKTPPPPIKVALVTAAVAPAPQLLTLTGMIAPNQRSEVTADTQGKVVAVLVERGQRVKMGDPVVRLDVQTAALSAREAQANLAAARAQKDLADEECKRTQALLDKGAITRSEYDRQSTQCTSALQQVSAAQARTEMIVKSVSDGLVRAPFAGVVTEKLISPGEWVAPGKPLFALVDDSPLKIELSVPEAAVSAVKKDQRVDLATVANPCWRFPATVTRLGGEIGKSRALIIEATIDAKNPVALTTDACKEAAKQPAPELFAGMFAEAALVVGEQPHPIVPATAVVKRGKLEHAFVAIKGELQDRIVQTSPAGTAGQLAVLQGIDKDERVVAQVTEQVVDGARVTDDQAPKAEAKPDAKAKE